MSMRRFYRAILVLFLATVVVVACDEKKEANVTMPSEQLSAANQKTPNGVAPSPSAGVSSSIRAQAVTPEGLAKGIPVSGVLRGRVYMGGGAIGKAEVVLAEFDLTTATTGIPLGLAVTDEHGNFSISYAMKEPQRFVKLEVRAIDYLGASDRVQRRVGMLNAVLNGLPVGDAERVAVTPITNVIYARFCALLKKGVDPDVAFSKAVSETRVSSSESGTGWSLNFNPLLTVVSGDDAGKLFHAAWDEAIRFDGVQADSYFSAMARDYADGKFDGLDEEGKQLAVVLDTVTRSGLM